MTLWTEEETRDAYKAALQRFEGREVDDALETEIREALLQVTAEAVKNGHLPKVETP